MTPPSARLLTKAQAATYCGLSAATFGSVCPVRPIALGAGVRMHRYDVREIDKWIDGFKVPEPANTSAMTLLDKMNAPTTLEDKYIKVLRYMRDHPECDTADDIRGAGDHTLDILAGKKLIMETRTDGNGKRRFRLTNEGKRELKRIEACELDGRR
jgi:hypothetical protein